MARTKKQILISRVVGIVLVLGAFGLLLGATSTKQEKVCKAVVINIDELEKKSFVTKNEVEAILERGRGKVVGKSIGSINLRELENQLEKNDWVQRSELFFDNNQVLNVFVEQRKATARIWDKSGATFYIDSTGKKMPVKMTERSDLPVFTNVSVPLDSVQLTNIIKLSNAIVNDKFWLAQAAQIEVLKNNQYNIYPSIGSHVISFGSLDDMEDKLNRIKTFYNKVAVVKGFDAYSKIDVTYKNQVVAERFGTFQKQDSGTVAKAREPVTVKQELPAKAKTVAKAETKKAPEKTKTDAKKATASNNKKTDDKKDVKKQVAGSKKPEPSKTKKVEQKTSKQPAKPNKRNN